MNLSVLFSHWNEIHKGTMSVLDGFNEVELNYTPYEGSWANRPTYRQR